MSELFNKEIKLPKNLYKILEKTGILKSGEIKIKLNLFSLKFFLFLILLLFLLATKAWPLIFLVFLSICLCLRWVYKKETRNIITKENQNYIENREKLFSSEDYFIVGNFAKKYGVDFGVLNNETQELNKLIKLLNIKGYGFTKKTIVQLLVEIKEKSDYDDFRRKILFSKPTTLEKYLKNMIQMSGSDYLSHLPKLFRLLKEQNVIFGEEDVVIGLKAIKENYELSVFEQKLKIKNFKKEDINSMSGVAFENLLKNIFLRRGYRVELTKTTGDQGADLVLERLGEKIVIQAKRSKNKVGNNAIQEAVASVRYYSADKGMVITNNEFTKSARELAERNDIELVENGEFEKMLTSDL